MKKTLTKRFSSNTEYFIDRDRLTTGIIIGVFMSIAFYGLFYFFRESFRFFTAYYGSRYLLLLDPSQTFVYNLFYSSLSCVLGYLFALKFIMENAIKGRSNRLRLAKMDILNGQAFSTWYFLLWFGKLGAILGIWYLTVPLQYDINFIEEYWLMLMLLPIVLFFSVWPSIYKRFKPIARKWLIYSMVSVGTLSLLMASYNFIDVEQINKDILSTSIEYTYDLQRPVSASYDRIERRSLKTDVYVVLDSSNNVRMLDPDGQMISFDSLNGFIEDARNEIMPFWDQLLVNLHIDRRIRLSEVNRIKLELRKAGVDRVQYSTGVKNSKYPPHYFSFFDLGLQEVLPRYNQILVDFLDSAERLDMTRYRITVPESILYRNELLKRYNRIEVSVSRESVFINSQHVNDQKLVDVVKGFIRDYGPFYVVRYNPDEDISFGRYIEYKGLLFSVVDRLRDEMSYSLYNQLFDYWDQRDPDHRKYYSHVRSAYPKFIIEFSSEEKRLANLERLSSGRD